MHAAVFDGESWTDEIVESGADGTGMAAATDGSSTFLTYYSGAGEVRLAERSSDGTWTTGAAAETNDPDEVTGVEAATTGVAVHEDTIYVTWQDEEGVQLVEGDGQTFTAVPSSGTTGGISPSVGRLRGRDGHARLVLADDRGPAGRVLGRAGLRDHGRQPEPGADAVSITAAPIECGGKVARPPDRGPAG